MNARIPTMPFRLTPRNTALIDLLSQAAAALVTGAEVLRAVVDAPPGERADLAMKMRDAEHHSDDLTHATLRKLNSTFVTPFDREDVYALASALDDCMDHMENASDMLVLTRPVRLPDGVRIQLDVLQQQARCTAAALPRLTSMTNLEEYWVEINRLENVADEAYRTMLAELFGGAYEPLELLKVKEVVDALEAAADAFETVSHHVETVAVKEA
jgi:predicted phosphate transport protein (TIGR00153 family)